MTWRRTGDTWWRHQIETFSALLALCVGNHRSPVNSPHKGQWRGALMFSLTRAWMNGWVNNRKAGFLGLNVFIYMYIYIYIYMYKDPHHEDNTVARSSYVYNVNSSTKQTTPVCWNNILRSTDASTILDDVTGVPWDRHYHERPINIYHTYRSMSIPRGFDPRRAMRFLDLVDYFKKCPPLNENVFKNVKSQRNFKKSCLTLYSSRCPLIAYGARTNADTVTTKFSYHI